MKRFLSCLLALVLTFSLCSCAAPTTPAETPDPAQTETAPTEADGVPLQSETPAETAAPREGSLFLNVSSINLSLVGDSEDIYLGMIPREDVTFESDDTSVVTFENGILTATGVGTTTVRAVYLDRQVECTAGCLAETQEELDALDPEILSAPKRLPPVVDLETECTYFDNSAIVGDSITYFMFQWESKNNYLGDILFLARGGVSLNGFVKRFKNIYYRGSEIWLEKAIEQSGVDRVYIMLGQNDLSSKARTIVMDNWVILLDRIRELNPDIQIYLQSCIPEYASDHSLDQKNDRIETYNETLREFARENDCHFIDLAYYIRDQYDRMPQIYSQGNYHMNEAGCLIWMQILRFYAQYELEGGDLS